MCTKYFFSKTLTSELSVIKQLLLQNHGQKSGGYSIPVRRKPKRKEVESERFVHCNNIIGNSQGYRFKIVSETPMLLYKL